MKTRNNIFSIIVILIVLQSCKKEDFSDISGFDDRFITYNSINDIFTNGNWTFHEKTYSENTLTIVHDTVRSDTNSIRMFCVPGNGSLVSKSGLASHHKILYKEGDIVKVSCWFYIPTNEGLNKLVILDLEDPAPISTGPGIRLMFDQDNAIFIERNKMGLSNITQNSGNKILFPFNKWVNITFELKLHTKSRGYIKLWQDGELIFDESSVTTLPRDRLYITQGTHKSYSNIEVGITANSTGHNIVMFIDDFSIWKIN
jgi:hypothetical protein